MMKKIKYLLLLTAIVLVAVGMAACGVDNPYAKYEKEGYTVSVLYDANGGQFSYVDNINVRDVFNPEVDMTLSPDGTKYTLKLLAPGDENRKDGSSKSQITKEGYFLAGWYVKSVDGNGNVSYSDRWDFENDLLEIDANGTYKASQPVLTLHAAWIPYFSMEFLMEDASGEWVTISKNDKINPLVDSLDIPLPVWEEGKVKTTHPSYLPAQNGKTYVTAYADAEKTVEYTQGVAHHQGTWDIETATWGSNIVQKVYTTWREGEWHHIYTASDFQANAYLSGCYELMGDLDFSDASVAVWPLTLSSGEFSGKIIGNGYKVINAKYTQTIATGVNAGLFGSIAATAQITDLHFENASVSVLGSIQTTKTSYFGLFAGEIDSDATVTNVTVSGTVEILGSFTIDNAANVSIGLVAGNLENKNISFENVSLTVGEDIYGEIPFAASADEEGKVTVTAVDSPAI